jgi:hypothetical protein
MAFIRPCLQPARHVVVTDTRPPAAGGALQSQPDLRARWRAPGHLRRRVSGCGVPPGTVMPERTPAGTVLLRSLSRTGLARP